MTELKNQIALYQRELNTSVFVLYGAPLNNKSENRDHQLINMYDHNALSEILNKGSNHLKLDKNECDIFLMTKGGCLPTALSIITQLKRKFRKVNVIVPRFASSCGTLMSFGADELYVNEKSLMSDFFPSDTPSEKIGEVVSKLESFLRSGSIVPSNEISKVILAHAVVNKQTNHKSNIPFVAFNNAISNILNIKLMKDLPLRIAEKDYVPHIDVLDTAIKIDQLATKILKDTDSKKLNVFSDISDLRFT